MKKFDLGQAIQILANVGMITGIAGSVRRSLARSLVLMLVLAASVRAQDPIIDMHLHAYPALPPASDPIWQAVPDYPALRAPSGPDLHRADTLRQMDRYNIVLGVLSGPDVAVRAWQAAEPGRFVGGAWLFFEDALRPSVEELRASIGAGVYGVLGELNLQYQGVSPDDPRLEPYFALAERFGLPVGIHSSGGPPGTPYFHDSRFRVSLGDPLLLEPVLLRHPNLKVYLMHAGHPFLERTKAILGIYPQVHVDVGVISWALPRAEFHSYLSALMESGFGDRVMFGSDQVFWPGAIEIAIEAVEEAPFLDREQKRDIFYNNAARFLGLGDEDVARHHGR